MFATGCSKISGSCIFAGERRQRTACDEERALLSRGAARRRWCRRHPIDLLGDDRRFEGERKQWRTEKRGRGCRWKEEKPMRSMAMLDERLCAGWTAAHTRPHNDHRSPGGSEPQLHGMESSSSERMRCGVGRGFQVAALPAEGWNGARPDLSGSGVCCAGRFFALVWLPPNCSASLCLGRGNSLDETCRPALCCRRGVVEEGFTAMHISRSQENRRDAHVQTQMIVATR